MFPSNPNINDLHTEQGKNFIFNGEGWVLQIDIDLLPANKANVDFAIGASSSGDSELLYNQKGDWVAGVGGGGTTNYDNLSNKPKINNVELSGNKTSSDLGLATLAQGAKADSALQSFNETDPTVPSWAKTPSKPVYTYDEVGAQPAGTYSTDIHSNITALNEVSGVNTGNETPSTIGALIETTELETITDTTKIAASVGGVVNWFSGLSIKEYIVGDIQTILESI